MDEITNEHNDATSQSFSDSDFLSSSQQITNTCYAAASTNDEKTNSESTKEKIKNDKKNNMLARISFITSVPSIVTWIALIGLWQYGGTSEGTAGGFGAGAFVALYGIFVGIPLAIVSITTGVIGLKTKYRWFSIAALSIESITIGMIFYGLYFPH